MKVEQLDKITLVYADNMEYMGTLPDKAFNLAVCDIPYGLKVGRMAYLSEMNTTVKQKNGTRLNGNKNKRPYTKKNWDSEVPTQEYFDELCRVSENQIIFGIEYTGWKGVGTGRIRWDKGFAEEVSFKRYETAYCSMIDYEMTLPLLWAGMQQAKSLREPMVAQGNKKLNEKRIHPTQKPVMLYQFLLMGFAWPAQKILDTHSGSLSIGIACHELGMYLTAIENDSEYYEAGKKRLQNYQLQQTMFK